MVVSQSNSFISKNDLKTKGLYSISFRRRITKDIVWFILFFMSLLLLLPLFSILYVILTNGLPVIFQNFPSYFVTRTKGSPISTVYGLQNALFGSVLVTAVASLIAIPTGILIGIYLASHDEGYFSSLVRLVADVLQSIPSIVAGVVILQFYVIPQGTKGYGYIAGGLALSILMLPIVARTTEEGIRTVPTSMYEAALSLGIPEWRIMLNVIINAARPVVLTGIFLAFARIGGETAPLIMTAGDNDFFPPNGHTPLATLTMKIYLYAITGYNQTWIPSAYAMAVVLIGFIFIISILVRTDIFERFLKHNTLKLMTFALSILVFIRIFSFMFDETLLFLVIAAFLKYRVFSILSEEDKFHKIWNTLLGKIVVVLIVLDVFAELILYYFGRLLPYIYKFNFLESEFLLLILGLYYINKYLNQGVSDTVKVRLLLVVAFSILLIKLNLYTFFYTFFNPAYIFMSTMAVLELIIFGTLREKGKIKSLWKGPLGKLFTLIIIFESVIEVLITYLGAYNYYLGLVNLGISLVLAVLIGLYSIISTMRVKRSENGKTIPSNQQIIKNFISIVFVGLMLMLLFNSINNLTLWVFLTALFLRYCFWYIILESKFFKSLWDTSYGKVLVYLECFEIAIQSILLFEKPFDNLVYQINYAIAYLLGVALILYFFFKYLYDQKNNFERLKFLMVIITAICALQYVYDSLIPIGLFGLTYELAGPIFSQIAFGLLLKCGVLFLLYSNGYIDLLIKTTIGKAILVLGLIETLAEFLVFFLDFNVKSTLVLIMGINGLLIYFIVLFFLVVVVFKVDFINRLLDKNVNSS